MTPTEQIHLETKVLEKQVADLIEGFEKRTGVTVQDCSVADFRFGQRRRHSQPLKVTVMIDLPPPPEESKESL